MSVKKTGPSIQTKQKIEVALNQMSKIGIRSRKDLASSMNISHTIASIIFNLPGVVLKGNRYILNDKKINISQLAETINLAQYNVKFPSNQRTREKLRKNGDANVTEAVYTTKVTSDPVKYSFKSIIKFLDAIIDLEQEIKLGKFISASEFTKKHKVDSNFIGVLRKLNIISMIDSKPSVGHKYKWITSEVIDEPMIIAIKQELNRRKTVTETEEVVAAKPIEKVEISITEKKEIVATKPITIAETTTRLELAKKFAKLGDLEFANELLGDV